MTTGPDDLDDLDVLKELGDLGEQDDADDVERGEDDPGQDLLDHPEDEVSLDARPVTAGDSVLASDEMLETWSDDDDALGTETGSAGPDRPRGA
jgi:hypothetical protein